MCIMTNDIFSSSKIKGDKPKKLKISIVIIKQIHQFEQNITNNISLNKMK